MRCRAQAPESKDDAMTRAEVCKRIETVGIVPVIRAPSPELALLACEAILAGGISVFEITMTIPDAPAAETTWDVIS